MTDVVDSSTTVRALYSYDASNYRVVPTGVATPRGLADVKTIVRDCLRTGTPVTSRGGGTSMAGNAVGEGVVIDFSRHMNEVLDLDVESRTVTVQAGMVLDDLQAVLAPHDLMFAPDPSSHSRATIGGLIGNDACGNHSVRYGRTSRHVLELEVLLPDGTHLVATKGGFRPAVGNDEISRERARELNDALDELVTANLAVFRTDLARLPRQVSGYQLNWLLPEMETDAAKALVGSEGTCVVIISATLALVPRPTRTMLVVIGYPSIVDGAYDVPTILRSQPAAVEGIEESIVAIMRDRRGSDSVLALPDGRSWLFVELEGEDEDALVAAGDRLVQQLAESGRFTAAKVVSDPAERAALWRVREDGAGLLTRPAPGLQTWAGWEDSAVEPNRLGDYLRDLRALLDEHGLAGVFYGHLGAGCVHIRIDFDLESPDGIAAMDTFASAAAHLVARHGGSLSGEHGDGRSRSALLPLMYGPDLIGAFTRFKRLFDPENLFNPGIIVDPVPITANLAPLTLAPFDATRTAFTYPHDPAGLRDGAGRCVGIGRCRSDHGGAMCPSYRATHQEKDSTRGRSRALQEMVRGELVTDGWRSEAVLETLDLCLSCKACVADCPVGVDVATYKADFLHQHYRRRLRPRSHYSLGWLPTLSRLVGWFPGPVNVAMRWGWLRRSLMRLGGVTTKRAMPRFASRSAATRPLDTPPDPSAVLFIDTFTRAFRPELAVSTQRVLSDAGLSTCGSAGDCCGLTWVSTGQLGIARRMLTRLVRRLDDGTDRPIVFMEPSCASTVRHDAVGLLDTDAARRVSKRVRTVAAVLEERLDIGWQPPPMPEAAALQVHCHEYAVFGAGSQRRVLSRLGVGQVTEAQGCCGLAGNFGFERDHYDTSLAIAELSLVPALASVEAHSAVVADGFSCQTQISHLMDDGRRPRHLAELIDDARAHQRRTTT